MNLPETPEFDFCIDLKVCLNFDLLIVHIMRISMLQVSP